MKEVEQKIKALLAKYLSASLSDSELDELHSYISTNKYDFIISKSIQENLDAQELAGKGLSKERSDLILNNILSEFKVEKNLGRTAQISRWVRTIAAVLIIGVVVSSWYYYAHKNNDMPAFATLPNVGTSITITNSSATSMPVHLEDGTLVMLDPQSTIIYPKHLAADKREVCLLGEAFFEVAKNPTRPFLVYHENLVTRVLGTSFKIKRNKQKGILEVDVHTGKVQVYERAGNSGMKKGNGVTIMPNERVIYNVAKSTFATSLVENPLPVLTEESNLSKNNSATLLSYSFNATPLSAIVTRIEGEYGVKIILSNDRLGEYLFSGDISTTNLFSKLDILCKALGISYEVSGVNIILNTGN